MSKSVYVYHEKQVGSLCGKHCMNSLLQGPFYTEVDLMRFAHELDEVERRIMAEKGTDTREFLEYMRNESENISDDGNFSIQVLTRALNAKGLEVAPFSRNLVSSSFMNTIGAFLVNQGKHWIAIRKVHAKWYNCNSFLDRPSFMSDFYLSSYLEGLLNDGFDIYFVRGNFPSALPYQRTGTEDGKWILMEGDEESDLKLALRESLELAKSGISEKDESPLIDHRQKSNSNPPIPKVFQNPLEMSMLRKSDISTETTTPKPKDPFEQWMNEDTTPAIATAVISPSIESINETNKSLHQLMETMDTFMGRLESAEKKLSGLERSWNLIAR